MSRSADQSSVFSRSPFAGPTILIGNTSTLDLAETYFARQGARLLGLVAQPTNVRPFCVSREPFIANFTVVFCCIDQRLRGLTPWMGVTRRHHPRAAGVSFRNRGVVLSTNYGTASTGLIILHEAYGLAVVVLPILVRNAFDGY